MSDQRYENGELFLSLEAVAAVYRVEAFWLREVYDAGLLPSGITREARVWVAALELDRIAAIVRLRAVVETSVESIGLLISDPS